jgi:ribosome-binding factor A
MDRDISPCLQSFRHGRDLIQMAFCSKARFLSPHLQRFYSKSTSIARYRNDNLRQVIAQGAPYLEETARNVMDNTRDRLFENKQKGPSPAQLSEAKRILETVTEVIDRIARKNQQLCVQGSPIVILDAEVSPDRRHARVFWCLPLHFASLDEKREEALRQQMQQILDGKGGNMIQSHVFGRLRSYYPPKIRFVPIPLKDAMQELL